MNPWTILGTMIGWTLVITLTTATTLFIYGAIAGTIQQHRKNKDN